MLFLPAQKFGDVSICRTRGGDRVWIAARRGYQCWWPDYWFAPFGCALTELWCAACFIPACGPHLPHCVYHYVGNIWAHLRRIKAAIASVGNGLMTSGRRRRRPWLDTGCGPSRPCRRCRCHPERSCKRSGQSASHPCLLSPRQALVSIVMSGPEPRQLVLRQRPAKPSMWRWCRSC